MRKTDRVAEITSELFLKVADSTYDFSLFLENYMRSDIRYKIDCRLPVDWEYSASSQYKLMYKVNGLSIPRLQASWLGEFVTRLQAKSYLSSRDIFDKLGVTGLYSCYNKYNSYDMDAAIDIVIAEYFSEESKVVCFGKDLELNNWLSIWGTADFTWGDVNFTSVLQYLMYYKAKLFNDECIANKILTSHSQAEMQSLGRRVSHYDDNTWRRFRINAILRGCSLKFKDKELRGKLLATRGKTLVECFPEESDWSCGYSLEDVKRFTPSGYPCANLAGQVLSQVRSSIEGSLNYEAGRI